MGIMLRANEVLDPAQTGREAQQLEAGLRQRIVGQDDAIENLVRAYQMYLAGMSSPGRPIATLLFIGPTGSGKTRLVEAMAESLFGDARAVIKIDCGEYQHSHEIAKLIGSPPGYLGHRETQAALSQEVLNQYHTDTVKLSFVLFDEIEKASDALWNLLLGILDKATLTLGDNRRVDFSRAMIIMTSNLGAVEMGSILRPNFGFAAGESQQNALQTVDDRLMDKISRAGVEAARRKFLPEFMNRIDRTVVFRALGQEELRRILSIELAAVQQRIVNNSDSQQFLFQVTDAGMEYLLREGADLKYGARHLKRSIERHLVSPLSNLIATQQVKGGDTVRVDFDQDRGSLIFCKDRSWSHASMAARFAAAAPPVVATRIPAVAQPSRWFSGIRNGKR
jgi:ATP-dependent Clp protease ATP-binding subunit ClpB